MRTKAVTCHQKLNVESGERPYFVIDNSDFENDTPDGKGEFHGTGMIACQKFTENSQSPLNFERVKLSRPENKIQGRPLFQGLSMQSTKTAKPYLQVRSEN